MRQEALIIASLLILCGCESDRERMIKVIEKRIATTLHQDWRDGIPLDDLATVRGYCGQMPELKGCEDLQAQLEDISISLASCQADQSSTLCKSFTRVVSKHPISSLLPKTYPVELPHTPFYWAMPTAALQAQAANFEYRRDVAYRWWIACSPLFLSCIALFIAVVSIWFGSSRWEAKKLRRAAQLAQQRTILAERERVHHAELARAHIEAERQARLEREAGIAEQRRIAAQQESERLAAEAAAKTAAEEAEVASLLDAACTSTKGKRRKNASSSH
ncbi:hypothetical protein ANRL1_00868 [Anaerolineae bacterium]|nr:hypothetical protein ANRL1_00868 [Anaerolineae bacterium]